MLRVFSYSAIETAARVDVARLSISGCYLVRMERTGWKGTMPTPGETVNLPVTSLFLVLLTVTCLETS
jgi:hypothetical protein